MRRRPTALAIAAPTPTRSPPEAFFGAEEDVEEPERTPPAATVTFGGPISPGFPTAQPAARPRPRAVARRASFAPDLLLLSRPHQPRPQRPRPQVIKPPRPPAPARIQPGTLVAFALSPRGVRLVAHPSEVEAYTRRKYLGLVYAVHPCEPEEGTVWRGQGEEVFIAFVAGFAPTGEQERARCAPLEPLASHVVPLGEGVGESPRAPLESVVRFPFPRHCAWTTLGVRATVQDVWPIAGAPVVLGAEDVERFRQHLADDIKDQMRAAGVRPQVQLPRHGVAGITRLHEDLALDVWFDVNVAGPDSDPCFFYEHDKVLNSRMNELHANLRLRPDPSDEYDDDEFDEDYA